MVFFDKLWGSIISVTDYTVFICLDVFGVVMQPSTTKCTDWKFSLCCIHTRVFLTVNGLSLSQNLIIASSHHQMDYSHSAVFFFYF